MDFARGETRRQLLLCEMGERKKIMCVWHAGGHFPVLVPKPESVARTFAEKYNGFFQSWFHKFFTFEQCCLQNNLRIALNQQNFIYQINFKPKL